MHPEYWQPISILVYGFLAAYGEQKRYQVNTFFPPQIPSIIENHNRSRATERFHYPFYLLLPLLWQASKLLAHARRVVDSRLGRCEPPFELSVCVIATGVGFPSLYRYENVDRGSRNP